MRKPSSLVHLTSGKERASLTFFEEGKKGERAHANQGQCSKEIFGRGADEDERMSLLTIERGGEEGNLGEGRGREEDQVYRGKLVLPYFLIEEFAEGDVYASMRRG